MCAHVCTCSAAMSAQLSATLSQVLWPQLKQHCDYLMDMLNRVAYPQVLYFLCSP